MSSSTHQPMVRTSPGDSSEETDADLIRAARRGDPVATAALYRRHLGAALRAARAIGGQGLAEDLVAEAFTRVLVTIRAGRGPDHALRPYLLTTIRHLFVDTVRRSAREVLVDDSTVIERAGPDDMDAVVDQSVMVDVLGALPDRWREILWRTIVLDEPLSVVGASMGLNANAAAALSFRARAGLAKAYRDAFVPTLPPRRRAQDGPAVRTA